MPTRPIKVQYGNSTGVATNVTVPFAMEGTDAAELIENIKRGTILPKSGSANIKLSINGGAGADSIINEGDNVYINGGGGNDSIVVRSLGNVTGKTAADVTSGVTIVGDSGADSIDVSQDFYTVASGGNGLFDTIQHAGHVFMYNATSGNRGDGKDVITGFSSADTIILTNQRTFENDEEVTNYLLVAEAGDVVLYFDVKNQITIKDGVRRLAGKPLKIKYTKTGENTLSSVNIPVPKHLIFDDRSQSITLTGGKNGAFDYSGYSITCGKYNDTIVIDGANSVSIDSAGNEDYITVNAHSAFINSGASSDRIVLLGGTNVDKDTLSSNYGKVIEEKAVTIYGGTSSDSVFAEEDYYANSGTTVYASHVYQFDAADNSGYVFGYNENDTIQIFNSDVAISAVPSNKITGAYMLSYRKGRYAYNIHLKSQDFMANKRINFYQLNASGNLEMKKIEGVVGYKTLEGGAERVVIEGETPDYYRLPKIISYLNGTDDFIIDSKYNGYTINASDADNTVVIDNASGVYVDAGEGNDYITVTGGSKDCSIFGGAGNDSIYIDNASGVYVDAGSGSDYVSIMSGVSNCTIANASGSLRAFTNNASGNVYIMTAKNKYTSILGYKENDTILIDGASYTQSVGSGFNYIDYEGNTANRLILKGALLEGKVAGSSVAADYDSLAGGTRLNISVKSGDKYIDRSTQTIFIGTTGADTMQVTLEGAIVSLGSGKDSVTVSGSYSSINASASIDAIWLESPATNCTIFGGAANDSIFNNSNGNIFYYTGSSGEGTDSLTAFNSNDLFYINDSACTVTDSIVGGNARLQITKGTTNTYVLILGKTTGDTVRIKLGAEGAIQTYTIGTGFSD